MTPGSCPSDTSAHPRSHGENHSKGGKARTVPGSSPLTRGKRGLAVDLDLLAGLIPAHAGKTGKRAQMRALRPAHPRSRGENGAFRSRLVCCGGSSPLTRGKPCQHRAPVPHAGLIPAHAGKTARRRCPCANAAAHPRSREENLWEDRIRALEHGSSPLTRGKHSCPPRSQSTARLIPAHAGKTLRQTMEAQLNAAHPRSRGENTASALVAALNSGSSPLTRGKPNVRPGERGCGRLIPAHAGKTGPLRYCCSGLPAHPRSRGENYVLGCYDRGAHGSSPLTRGKPHHRRQSARHRRLIPAHAGKTGLQSRGCYAQTAHPRSRGENLLVALSWLFWVGSSPLTRGKHTHARTHAQGPRLIPAHAGKTWCGEGEGACGGAHPRSRGEN